jgi:pyruvate/2-oxoglutarate/acetoin dehydrogenase E1 component
MPVSEAGFVGMAVGAAMTGLRPVVDVMFLDFVLLAMDQIVNQAAHMRYMTGGQVQVPIVIRGAFGAGGIQRRAALAVPPRVVRSHVPGSTS